MNIKLLNIFKKNLFYFVVCIAFVLRFYDLGTIPPSLYWDEVSQGFNSFSILKTGADEHQEFFPIARFQAFGDYKAPVYIYLDIIPILFFGQTEFAVRLPSAILGLATVVLCYFLVLELFREEKWRKKAAIFSSLLLAISPWHIQLSRVAYEANVATFFTVLGVFLFLLSLRKSSVFIFFSTFSFVIAFYSFNAHRIFIPTLVVLLLVIFHKKLYKNLKTTILTGVLAFILLIPFIFYLSTPESKLRFREVNIFSDISVVEESNKFQIEDNNSTTSRILHNRRLLYGLTYIKHYLDFFNPSYLFFNGDVNPRFSTQQTGQLYLYTLPFILFGIYIVLKKRNKYTILLIFWFLLAPIAAATARETPHALRSETFIPLFDIFAGVGFAMFFYRIKKFKKLSIAAFIIVAFISIYYLTQFIHAYFVHMPRVYSQDWQYGYKETIKTVEKIKNNYDRIIFSNEYGRAYIYVLWYGKYSPLNYWENGVVSKDEFGFYNVDSFGKYIFKSPRTFKKDDTKKELYIGVSSEIPKDARKLRTIKFLDNSEAFTIADNSK